MSDPSGELGTCVDHASRLRAGDPPQPTISQAIHPIRNVPELPDYEVIRELGRGGMGVVYLARHRVRGHLVALKTILAGVIASVEERVRFQIEADILACLHHPNIVRLYEVGEHEGHRFFALEYVPGISLATYLEHVKITPQRAAELLEQLARAVHHAHSLGILHRDLKPANILLSRPTAPKVKSADYAAFEDIVEPDLEAICQANDLQIKITDFGVGKWLSQNQDVTATGLAIGTPGYMAPENALGRAKTLGPTADVFSLGVILYEMLAGRPAFSGDSVMETMMNVVHRQPPSLRSSCPDLPRDLQTICERCLEKDPARRYTTAEALAEDLRRFRQGATIVARPCGDLQHLVRWARHRPATATLLGMLFLIAVVGSTAFAMLWWAAENARKDAEQLRKNAEIQGQLASLAREEAESNREKAESQLYFTLLARAVQEHTKNHIGESNDQLDRCDEKRRGWEWDLLRARNHADILTLSDITGSHIRSLTFSGKGTQLGASSGNFFDSGALGQSCVWAFPSGRKGFQSATKAAVHDGIALFGDGENVILANSRGEVQIWDRARSHCLSTWKTHQPGLICLVLSPDERTIVTAGENDRVLIFRDRLSGAIHRRVILPIQPRFLRFQPNGRLIAAASIEGDVVLIEASTGNIARVFRGIGKNPCFHPTLDRVLTVRGCARIWDVQTGRTLQTLGGEVGQVLAAEYSPDGKLVATAGADGIVRLWDLEQGIVVASMRGHRGRVGVLAFHPSGRYLASGGEQPCEIKVWDLTRNPEYGTLPTHIHDGEIQAIAFAPGGKEILSVRNGMNGVCTIQDHATERTIREFPVEITNDWLTPANLAAFTNDSRFLATIGTDLRSILIYDTLSGDVVHRLRDGMNSLFRVAWSLDGQHLITAGFNQSDDAKQPPTLDVQVWDRRTGQRLARIEAAYAPPLLLWGAIGLSPNGQMFAHEVCELTEDKQALRAEIYIRSVANGAILHRLPLPPGTRSRSLQFAPDGRLLAVSTSYNGVQLWDVSTGKRVETSNAMHGPNYGLAFHPQGHQLAGVDRDGVKIWDVKSGHVVIHQAGSAPRLHDLGFNPQLAWAPDGRGIAISNQEQEISIWLAKESASPEAKQQMILHAELRARSWHFRQALLSLNQGNAFAYNFHREQLEWLPIRDRRQHIEMAMLLAQVGEWKQAWKEWQASGEAFKPTSTRQAYLAAVLALKADDPEGYRKVVAAQVDHFKGTQPSTPWVYQPCVCLAPLETIAKEDLLRLTKQSRAPSPGTRPWEYHVLALAQYRIGNFSEAIQITKEACKKNHFWPLYPANHFLLAMAHFRAGDEVEGRKWYTQARTEMAYYRDVMKTKAPRIGPANWPWRDWAMLEIIEAEANDLIK